MQRKLKQRKVPTPRNLKEPWATGCCSRRWKRQGISISSKAFRESVFQMKLFFCHNETNLEFLTSKIMKVGVCFVICNKAWKKVKHTGTFRDTKVESKFRGDWRYKLNYRLVGCAGENWGISQLRETALDQRKYIKQWVLWRKCQDNTQNERIYFNIVTLWRIFVQNV